MSKRFYYLAASALFIVVAFAGCTALAKGDTPVPNLINAPHTYAEIALRNAELRLGDVTFDENAQGPTGVIIEQNPEADSLTVKNGRVHIVVSGPDLVPLPSLIGKHEEDAFRILEDADLRRGKIVRIHDTDRAAGTVIAQNPHTAQVPRNTKIALSISLGPETSPIPNVTRMWDIDAKDSLYDIGFKPSVRKEYDRYAEGIVLEQSPPPGTDAQLGEVIELVVSKGPLLIKVPDVCGLDVADAITAIKDAGLVPVENRDSSALAEDASLIVEIQSPLAGSKVSEGSGVTLVVRAE